MQLPSLRGLGVLCLVLALTCVALLPHLQLPGVGWLPQLQALVPLMLPLLAVAIAVVALRRRWRWTAVTVAVLASAGYPLLAPSSAAIPDTAESLSVLSFNAGRAQADPDELAAVIRAEHPEVLVLVETSEPLHRELERRGALADYQYRTAPVPTGGQRDTVIFSALPLKEPTPISDTGWYELPAATVEFAGSPVMIAAVHVRPPLGESTTWAQGLAALGRWTEAAPAPVVLAGDFNAHRGHPAFRQFADTMSSADGLVAAPTWSPMPQLPSLLTIDHQLSKGLKARQARTFEVAGSDHRALLARFTPQSSM